MKILITGATGLIGKKLTNLLLKSGHNVSHLSRSSSAAVTKSAVRVFKWNVNEKTIDAECVKDVDVVVHLAGANLNEKRWTPAFKREIIDSRVESTRLLEIAISQSETKPKAIIRQKCFDFSQTISLSLSLSQLT